jgi:hypothetical protein
VTDIVSKSGVLSGQNFGSYQPRGENNAAIGSECVSIVADSALLLVLPVAAQKAQSKASGRPTPRRVEAPVTPQSI